MSADHTPSAGARRAATLICADALPSPPNDTFWQTIRSKQITRYSEIIDRETGTAELLKALKKCLSWTETYAREVGIDVDTSGGPLALDVDFARAAIAKAEGQA